jgi:N6-L-threonylcarbamoyladenine synthase
MIILAVETSCDDTGVALVQDGRILSNVVASQARLHTEYGGIVPELAAREHVRNWDPVSREAFRLAGLEPASVQAVAVTQGPGLPGALLVGFRAAQAFAYARRLPIYGVHHHEAHLYSPWISGEPPAARFAEFEPSVSLIVSGGHTVLVHVAAPLDHRLLGATVDDAAGECFDKAAKLLGLGYPGGPEIERLAGCGDARAHAFPRPMLSEPADNFSFSGLKTAVRYFVRDHPGVRQDPSLLSHLCASLQAAIVDVLVVKTLRAARRLRVRCVTASGGVLCNRVLRAQLATACAAEGLRLRVADRRLCTDNAGMIGVLAELRTRRGVPPMPLDAEIRAYWPLDELGSATRRG